MDVDVESMYDDKIFSTSTTFIRGESNVNDHILLDDTPESFREVAS